jgi:hypothetical protein
MFDVLKFYQDFNIPHIQSGHKHARAGWVNTACPFCTGNPGWHLGFCTNTADSRFSGRFVCYRCGGKGVIRTVGKLLGLRPEKAREVACRYGLGYQPKMRYPKEVPRLPKRIQLPEPKQSIMEVPLARQYIEERRFHPVMLADEWGVYATTGLPVTYPYRIVTPITYKRVPVSYQGRTYTGAEPKYKACDRDKESIHHKDIVYGLDKARDYDTCIIVEGVFDVFRIGPGAVATFGIKYRTPQVYIIARHFARAVLLFDDDPQARWQSEKICADLAQRGLEVEELILDGHDPADMSDTDARAIRKEFLDE